MSNKSRLRGEDAIRRLPFDWQELVTESCRRHSGRAVCNAINDPQCFGNGLLVLSFGFVLFRLIKDRSDEWIEVRLKFVPGWFPLRVLLEQIRKQDCAHYGMFEEMQFMKNKALSLSLKERVLIWCTLLFHRGKLHEIARKQNLRP